MFRKCFIYEIDEDIELMAGEFGDILVRKINVDGDEEISYEDFLESVKNQRELLECFG